MGDYRRFTKTDWYGYSCAEKFSENQQPFMYDRVLNDCQVCMTIIADKNGIQIIFYDEDDSVPAEAYVKAEEFSSTRAEGELRHLIAYLEQFTYAPDITYELDHPRDDSTKGFTYIGCYAG